MVKKLLVFLMLLLAHISSNEAAVTSISKSRPKLVILPGASAVFHNSVPASPLKKVTWPIPNDVDDD